ncbi:MAG: hypothetical protein ABIY90_15455 [Puia sp.]
MKGLKSPRAMVVLLVIKRGIAKSILLLILCLFYFETGTAQALRDPLKWPFDKYSIWNVPVHNNATYVFAAIQPAERLEIDEDIIIMTPTVALMNVKENNTGWSAGGSARCTDLGPALFSAPIPQDFTYSNNTWIGNTPNAGASILLPNGKIKQTQPFAKCNRNYATSQYTWDENNCVLTGECIIGAHGGSNLSAIGGTLRVGEFTSGKIKHVLKINLWGKENFYKGKGGFRWPATTADAGFRDSSSSNYYGGSNSEMRIGVLLALCKEVNLTSVTNNSMGIESEPGIVLARALQDYGAYAVDNTAWDTYAIITEQGPNGSVRNEFQNLYGYSINQGDFLSGNAWARDLKNIFSHLYVIANNGPGNIGGGPTTDSNRRAAFACDIGVEGTGNMCSLPVPGKNISHTGR